MPIIYCNFDLISRLFIMKKVVTTTFVFLLLAGSFSVQAQVITPRGDVNQDGSVSISDVTSLIDYLLTGTWPEDPLIPDESEYVDLGLPSGTLWATRNIGAHAPEDYGDYYAWGETEPKSIYQRETYKWYYKYYQGNTLHFSLTKYCTNSVSGTVDNKTELDPEDDAAYVNWGASWRMPTSEQMNELMTTCTWTWTTQNGVKGSLIIGPNGNTLFLPAAGSRINDYSSQVGSAGFYWSRMLSNGDAYAKNMTCSSAAPGNGCSDQSRWSGFSVRAVLVSQN